jgi:hypothetical protein
MVYHLNKKNTLRRAIATGVSALCLTLAANSVWASVSERFGDLNFSNPAELADSVKDLQLIYGDSVFMPHRDWNGTVVAKSSKGANITTTGTAESTDNTMNSPFGRFAVRLSPQWVLGVDVTKPFVSLYDWPIDLKSGKY